MKHRSATAVFIMLALVSCSVQKTVTGQPAAGSDAYSSYIAKYSDMAVDQMKKYGIPASITLAQGLLESDAGRSTLATRCNNHFGIKCHSDWTGGKMYHDDDAKGECFRCYKSADESFRDHSQFLLNGSRYKSLFSLKSTDYKGWAKGLKAAGYATSPTYATKLIEIIERYGLDSYDTGNGRRLKQGQLPHQPLLVNDLNCVKLRDGETLKDIAREYQISISLLRRFNEVSRKYVPPAGSNIFLERKKARADRENRTYTVRPGDTLWSISQQYGIKLGALSRRNRLGDGRPLTVGMVLLLR